MHGSTAVYSEILPGVDLRLGAQQDGFTQLLVVKSAEAAANPKLAEMRLRLDAHGMDVRETAGGGLEAVDQGAGGTVFEAAQPLMWDSSPGPGAARSGQGRFSAAPEQQSGPSGGKGLSRSAAGEPGAGDSGKLAPVGVDVAADQSALVLRPDAGVLKGPDTVYPVFIDPQFYSPKASAWTVASKYWASSPQWKFNGDPDAGLGYCGWDYCKPYDTKRLFYRIPVSKFAGKNVLSAEFVVRNTWSASCSARSVELWRTDDISDATHWNRTQQSSFWIDRLKTLSFAHGFDGCESKDAEFDVRTAVQQAADRKDRDMTFGLRAGDEGDRYGWKRFSDDAFLRVKYNRPPPQVRMEQLSMQFGGTCKKPADARRSRSLGTIYANNVTDPDGDKVAVDFQAAWDGGSWKPARTSYAKSGSDFAIDMPSHLPENKQIGWQVRVHDGGNWSPWSSAGDPTACYFTYDTTVPKSPSISSLDYPQSVPANPDDPWHDGTGKYGSFEIRANDSQVTKYWYGLNVDATSSNTINTTSGAPRTIPILPTKAGLNTLYVRSVDAAGNVSSETGYRFRVKSGQPERAQWTLDDPSGAAQAAGSAPGRSALLLGGATSGTAGVVGTAVTFDGIDDYARTDIPTVSTDTGFSVSAWAKLSAMPDTAAVIAAQPGNHSPGFELYYSKSYDRWVFNQYTADSANAGIVRAMPAQAGGVSAGQWTHLVGTYSSSSGELKLYVNGALAGTTSHTTAWDARRGLQIGAGSYLGNPSSYFPGVIDEVQIFDKPVSPEEVTVLHGKQQLTTGRPARAVFSMDTDPQAPSELNGTAQVPSAVFRGGPSPGTAGIAGKALTLDGVDDYADAARPLLNNQRSFAVAAWAKLPKTKPSGAAVIVTQTGVHKPGFELYYSKAHDSWAFNTYSADAPNAVPVRVTQDTGVSARGGEWAHLVGVYDDFTRELTLYVNGRKANTPTAVADDWYAGGGVQIGAGEYGGVRDSFFPGQIDDIRLYDRTVSAVEVQQLFKQQAVVKGRWKFENATGAPAVTPDASGSGHEMTLNDGAQVGTGKGWVDGGIVLDGVNDYATADMPVDTSASFTVSAFVQAAAVPKKPVTVLSAPGAQRSALSVQYQPGTAAGDPGRWRISTADRDATTASPVQVDNSQFHSVVDTWTHLALVYDGFAKQLSLYVNGELEEVACNDTDGDGTPDEAGCTERASWSEDVLTFRATQPLQVGRGKTGITAWGDYWPGALSDVWAFQGTLTDAQVAQLAVGMPGMPTEVPGRN
ncbi:LamG domain-containing protein [Streptomyces jumonjinensis]|uniref:LamG domain-containing protein n=1 Tax=Streptomyces jumonjinensis TaxID=1945 RepID=UPI0037A4484E